MHWQQINSPINSFIVALSQQKSAAVCLERGKCCNHTRGSRLPSWWSRDQIHNCRGHGEKKEKKFKNRNMYASVQNWSERCFVLLRPPSLGTDGDSGWCRLFPRSWVRGAALLHCAVRDCDATHFPGIFTKQLQMNRRATHTQAIVASTKNQGSWSRSSRHIRKHCVPGNKARPGSALVMYSRVESYSRRAKHKNLWCGLLVNMLVQYFVKQHRYLYVPLSLI